MNNRVGSILCLGLLASGAALAQTPECPCPIPPATPPIWSGSAELSYLSTSGNTSTSSIGGAVEVDYKPAPWGVVFKAFYLRAESNHETTAEQLGLSLKGGRNLTDRIDVFTQASYLRNRFAGIEDLISGEAGAGYKILGGPVHTLRPEIAVGYTHKGQTVAENQNYASGRAGLSYIWQFSKTAAFTNDASYLYDFQDSSNWFFLEKAAVSAALTTIFSLKASWALTYSNEPVPTFKKTDTATAFALVAKF